MTKACMRRDGSVLMVFTTLFIFPACMTELMTQLEYLSIAGAGCLHLPAVAYAPACSLDGCAHASRDDD